MIRYAIFDLDGTLLDSMWIWENIDLELLMKYGKIPSPALREKIRTMSVKDACEFFKDELSLSASVEEMIGIIGKIAEEKYEKEVRPKKYVPEMLRNFSENGVRMCVATASLRKNALTVLRKFDLLRYFDFILAADDVKTSKDDPEIFNLCAEKLGVSPGRIVVFEDSFQAAQTAKKAGFPVCGVYDRFSREETENLKSFCDFYIENMGQWEEFL